MNGKGEDREEEERQMIVWVEGEIPPFKGVILDGPNTGDMGIHQMYRLAGYKGGG